MIEALLVDLKLVDLVDIELLLHHQAKLYISHNICYSN